MSRRRCTAFVVILLLSASLADATVWPKRWRRKPSATSGQSAPVDPKNPNSKSAANEVGEKPGQVLPSSGKHGAQIKGPLGVVIVRGQTVQLTWSVIGTTDPVRMIVKNYSPDIGKLNGGDTQTVTTSGGEMNVVHLTVTGVKPGELVIKVDDDSEHARQIADAFRSSLKSIADRLEVAAQQIPVIRAERSQPSLVRRDDVLRLLEGVEEEVGKALPYSELAPFRDAVAELVRNAKNEIDGQFHDYVPRTRASARNGIELVRNDDVLVPGTIEEAVFRALVRSVTGFLRRAGETSPIDTLCVLTTPENGANIVLYPPSLPSDRRGLRTASRVALYLGRYAVEINNRSVGFVNILLDPERVIECSLRTAVNNQACRPISGTLERCP